MDFVGYAVFTHFSNFSWRIRLAPLWYYNFVGLHYVKLLWPRMCFETWCNFWNWLNPWIAHTLHKVWIWSLKSVVIIVYMCSLNVVTTRCSTHRNKDCNSLQISRKSILIKLNMYNTSVTCQSSSDWKVSFILLSGGILNEHVHLVDTCRFSLSLREPTRTQHDLHIILLYFVKHMTCFKVY